MSVPGSAKISVRAEAKTWAFDRMSGTGSLRGGGAGSISPLIGKSAPSLELPLLAGPRGAGGKGADPGAVFRLADSIGKEVIVLDFWTTWCAPCLKALPELRAAVARHESKGVRLVTVNQGEDPERVESFLRTRGWEMDVALDADLSVRKRFGVTGIPTTLIIGRDGKVRAVHVGYQANLGEQLDEDIRAALDR